MRAPFEARPGVFPSSYRASAEDQARDRAGLRIDSRDSSRSCRLGCVTGDAGLRALAHRSRQGLTTRGLEPGAGWRPSSPSRFYPGRRFSSFGHVQKVRGRPPVSGTWPDVLSMPAEDLLPITNGKNCELAQRTKGPR